MQKRDLEVWSDTRSIPGGKRWYDHMEKGIREARGVVVLITAASARSEWVTYEYAFAAGARIPIVAVAAGKAKIPGPLQGFQIVPYSEARQVAEDVDNGILDQSRTAGQERATAPKLMAKFQEENGKIRRLSSANLSPLRIDLWIENAPRQTKHVDFEILDLAFKDRQWHQQRTKPGALREFLTNDMNSYGDVEIWARGTGTGSWHWLTKSTLYEALVRYHTDRPARRGLRQIREN